MKFRLLFAAVCAVGFGFSAFFATPATVEAVQTLLLPGIGTMRVSSVLEEAFDLASAWETYSSPTGVELGVENGVYRAYTANAGYVWGLNSEEHTNMVAEIDVTPLTPFQDIGAGIMCRADVSNNGDGYYFMVNANGYYSIRMGQGDEIVPLIDWEPSTAIHAGIDQNTIRAVCVEDQLAMYVNDELVANIVDDTYSSGYAGLAVAAGENGVDMAFDNLILYSIQIAQV
ncbi:MAG: hypothetical protein ABI835_03540 [Chloroflexota bacterium]